MKFFRLFQLLAAGVGFSLPLRAELVDGVKAVVSSGVVTIAEVDDFVIPAAQALRREYAGDQAMFQQKLDSALNDGLEQLIERQLILRDFDVEQYRLPDTVVDELVQDRIRERFGDRITLMKTLQAQGQTFEKFRQEVRDQYIVSALRAKNISPDKIIISPYKVETYYLAHQDDFKVEDEIKLRMIVLNKTSGDDTNTLNLANEILGQDQGRRDVLGNGLRLLARFATQPGRRLGLGRALRFAQGTGRNRLHAQARRGQRGG